MNKYSRQKASTYAMYRYKNRGTASFVVPRVQNVANFMDYLDPSAYGDAAQGAWQHLQGMNPFAAKPAPAGVEQLQGYGNRMKELLTPGRTGTYNPGATQPSPIYDNLQGQLDHRLDSTKIPTVDRGGKAEAQGMWNRLKGYFPGGQPQGGNALQEGAEYLAGHPGQAAAGAGGAAALAGGGLIARLAAKKKQAQALAAQAGQAVQGAGKAIGGMGMGGKLGLGALAVGGVGAGLAGLNAMRGGEEEAAYGYNQYLAQFSRGNGTRHSMGKYARGSR